MTYTDQLQRIANDYFATHDGEPTAKDIARWAIETRRWEAPADSIVQKCAEDIARAMREEYLLDPQGRQLRAKHAVRLRREDGSQMVIWADIRSAPPEHVHRAFQQRREQIQSQNWEPIAPPPAAAPPPPPTLTPPRHPSPSMSG